MFDVRIFVWLGLLYAASLNLAYGQRVYADNDQISATALIAGVDDRVNAKTSPYTDFSHLYALIGVAGLVGTAYQNLQFTGAKPGVKSPVYVKFSVGGGSSVATLLGGVTLQATKDNVPVTTISNSVVLSVLTPAVAAEVKFTPDVLFDGFRISISALVGIGLYVNYYYAFFITPPTASNVTVCTGQPATLNVSNVQSGYQYKWYTAETGGSELATTTGSYTTGNILSAQSFYVEAVESGTYNSARTRINISVLSRPSTPMVHLNN